MSVDPAIVAAIGLLAGAVGQYAALQMGVGKLRVLIGLGLPALTIVLWFVWIDPGFGGSMVVIMLVGAVPALLVLSVIASLLVEYVGGRGGRQTK